MPSNLAAYLAKNYLTASTPSSHPDGPPKKKRKKSKHQPETTSLVIADDDEDLTLSSAAAAAGADDDADLDGPLMFEGRHRSAEFRKAKKNAWKSLAEPQGAHASDTTTTTTHPTHDVDDADQLLQIAQSDEARRLAELEAENAPAVVEMDVDHDNDNPTTTENGLRAGLQTAADAARREAESSARERTRKTSKKPRRKDTQPDDEGQEEEAEEQTIYRDATGRRIDISLRRAEARREAAAKQAAARAEKLSAMGDVQRRELETRKQDLADAQFLTLGRGVDDAEYNDRLRGVVRWDDPMAAYMAEKEADTGAVAGAGVGKAGKEAGGVPRNKKKRKEYPGAAPPNRYAIKPGWRWDGVDRGNGFEKEWFQARGRKARNDTLSYEWQMDE